MIKIYIKGKKVVEIPSIEFTLGEWREHSCKGISNCMIEHKQGIVIVSGIDRKNSEIKY